MVNLKRRLSFIVTIIFLALAIFPLFSYANLNITNPINNSILTQNLTTISVNLTNFNTALIQFYYKKINESSYTLLNTNTTQNLSQYSFNWNITNLTDFTYELKVNASNSTTQINSINKIYIDKVYPNITNYSLKNPLLNNKSVFNNGSFSNLTLDLNESNYSIKQVNYTLDNNTNQLTWNSTLKLWTTVLELISTRVLNNITITAIDFSNKKTTRNISVLIDLNSPIINTLTIPTGNKTDPALDAENQIELNITDDINLSSQKIYLDDILINSTNNTNAFYYTDLTIQPNVGKHNITIIATDIFNKTTKLGYFVHWWFASSSNSFLQAWEQFANNSNPQIDKVYIAKESASNAYTYEEYPTNNKWFSKLENSGLIFNSTNYTIEFLNIEKDNSDILEFNFNKTPLIYINNQTTIGEDLISNIQDSFTTSVIDLVYVNTNTNKTAFIGDETKYYARTTLPKNFSNISNYDTIFYFEHTNLSTKQTLFQNDTCADSEYPFTKLDTRACYLIQNGKTIIYTPKHGIISANKDNIKPKINFNSYTHNDSVNFKINFTTTELTFCNVTIINEDNQSNFLAHSEFSSNSLENYEYDFQQIYFKDGDYNITIQCRDLWNNTNQTNKIISVLDTTPPEITIISPTQNKEFSTTSSNSYTFTIEAQTNEPSDIIYKIDTGFPQIIEENTTLTSTQVTKATGSYVLRIIAEDIKGNINSKEVDFSIDARIIETETAPITKTTGIVITKEENTTQSTKESKTWYKVYEEEKIDLLLNNPLFDLTKISFIPKENITNLKIEVEIIRDNYPIKIANNSHKIYQYYKIEEPYTKNKIINPEFTFRILKSWFNQNNIEKIIILRNHNNTWSNITPTKIGEDNIYLNYKMTTPGFSYYVIAGIEKLPRIEKPTIIKNITTNETNNTNNNQTKDISTNVTPPKKSSPLKLIILFLVLTSLIAGVIYSYKTIQIPVLKYEDLTKEEKTQLQEFISKRLSAGVAIHKIETELINHGWSQDITSKIIRTVNVPKQKEEELNKFIEKMRTLKNISDYDLKKALINVGWQPEVVDNILKKK